MKNFHKLIVILVLLGLPFMAEAQFYSVGDDPGRLKWYSIESRNYRIIYPGGLDSLARVYGEMLEQYRLPAGASAGYFPGEMTRSACLQRPVQRVCGLGPEEDGPVHFPSGLRSRSHALGKDAGDT